MLNTDTPEGAADELTEIQEQQLTTIQKVLKIEVNGDWDEAMINLAFDRLEKLMIDDPGTPETTRSRSRSRSGSSRRRRSRSQ